MRALIKILYLLFILISSVGCISYLEITKNLPPEIKLDKKPLDIAFVNLYDYEMLDFNSDNKIEVYYSGTKKLLESLNTTFKNNDRFNFVITDTLVKGRCWDILQGRLSSDSVVYYCREGNAEYLLVLDAFRLYFDKEMEVKKEDDGTKSRTAHYSLVLKVGLSLYDSTGFLIDQSTISNSKFYQSRSVASGLLAIGPSMGGTGTETNALASELGGDYIKKFYPTSVIEMKQIYVGKKFAEITPLMKNGKWEEAKEKLLLCIDSDNYKLRRRASHNLCVAYEALGRMDLAEKWRNESRSPKLKDSNYKPDKAE
jgi:hypothetical protein